MTIPISTPDIPQSGSASSTRGGASRRTAPQLVRVQDRRWRVTRADGAILGYVESFDSGGDERFRASRFVARQQRTVDAGEFWRANDAVDALRFG